MRRRASVSTNQAAMDSKPGHQNSLYIWQLQMRLKDPAANGAKLIKRIVGEWT